MTLEELKAAYPAWAAAHKNATGYRYCANCGAMEESCMGMGEFSKRVPGIPGYYYTPLFIRFYDEIGELCLECAESLQLTGFAAQQLAVVLNDPDVRWYKRRARERGNG